MRFEIVVVILVACIIAVILMPDESAENYMACIGYGCPDGPLNPKASNDNNDKNDKNGKNGKNKSAGDGSPISTPQGNVVLNSFLYPYSGSPDFEHDANGNTIQKSAPFVAETLNGERIVPQQEPDHRI